MHFLHLLFPEAPVDDAAAQVVHPLPLNDVIQDELTANGGSQLTWSQRKTKWLRVGIYKKMGDIAEEVDG